MLWGMSLIQLSREYLYCFITTQLVYMVCSSLIQLIPRSTRNVFQLLTLEAFSRNCERDVLDSRYLSTADAIDISIPDEKEQVSSADVYSLHSCLAPIFFAQNNPARALVQFAQQRRITISCPHWRLMGVLLTLLKQAEIGEHQVDGGEDAQWSFRDITFFRRWRAIVEEGVHVRMWTSYPRNWLHPEAEDGLFPQCVLSNVSSNTFFNSYLATLSINPWIQLHKCPLPKNLIQ